jgi:hypothetical protein
VVATALPLPALAVDGVVEINQSKVNALGGFPYNINATGSYRLTSTLRVPSGAIAIKVNASDVTIDLNGFSIIGPGTSGPAFGIDAQNQHLITIYNGEVAGMITGIRTGHSSRIERVRALGNGNGIDCEDGCEIFHNIANNNGFGIIVHGSGRISSNVTQFNSLGGIATSDGSVVSDNTANSNGAMGGIEFLGCTDSSCLAGGTVTGNTANSNAGPGITAGRFVGYAENSLSRNGGHSTFGDTNGQVSGGGNLGHNLCNGVLCP